MHIGRHSPAALVGALLIAASLTGSASGRPASAAARNPGQSVALDRACNETVANVRQAVIDAPKGPVQAIDSHLQVVTPGVLIGQITFNASGKQVTVGGPRADAAAASLGCGVGTAGGERAARAAGGSRVVSTLHRKFTKAGHYELTFTLNRTGRQLLALLVAADKAYYQQHPHGPHPPTLAFGVSLSYSLAG